MPTVHIAAAYPDNPDERRVLPIGQAACNASELSPATQNDTSLVEATKRGQLPDIVMLT
jgi:hypothetical protein